MFFWQGDNSNCSQKFLGLVVFYPNHSTYMTIAQKKFDCIAVQEHSENTVRCVFAIKYPVVFMVQVCSRCFFGREIIPIPPKKFWCLCHSNTTIDETKVSQGKNLLSPNLVGESWRKQREMMFLNRKSSRINGTDVFAMHFLQGLCSCITNKESQEWQQDRWFKLLLVIKHHGTTDLIKLD